MVLTQKSHPVRRSPIPPTMKQEKKITEEDAEQPAYEVLCQSNIYSHRSCLFRNDSGEGTLVGSNQICHFLLIQILHMPNKGKCLFARRDIPAGEIIVSEKPLIIMPDAVYRLDRR